MKNILCFGDSNTFGYNIEDEGRFPWGVRWTSLVQEFLGNDYHIIEEGLNARTTVWDDPIEDAASGKTCLRPCIKSHWPLDLVIIMLGTNDLKPRFSMNTCDIAAGVEELVKRARIYLAEKQDPIPPILIISPIEIEENIVNTPYGEYLGGEWAVQRSREFPKYFSEVAKAQGCEFMAASDFAVPCEQDQIHMDAENHRKLAVAIYEKIKEIL